jgi:hypothetical protein
VAIACVPKVMIGNIMQDRVLLCLVVSVELIFKKSECDIELASVAPAFGTRTRITRCYFSVLSKWTGLEILNTQSLLGEQTYNIKLYYLKAVFFANVFQLCKYH